MRFIRPFIAIAATTVLFNSCFNKLTEEDYEKNRAREGDYFSFNTTDTVGIQLDYGTVGARALIKVYTEDPVVSSGDKTAINPDLVPVYQIFTDNNGKVSDKLQLPSYITEGVWICSDFMAMPSVEYCLIDDGIIHNWNPNVSESTKASAQTKAVDSPTLYYILGNYYTITKWQNKYGKPHDVNSIYSTGDIASELLTIKAAVWQGHSSKPSGLDNRSHAAKGTKWINTTIRPYYHDEQGKVQVIESAQVYFTFVQESAWNQNLVGYYYYPSDQVPSSPDNLKKYIFMPNASIPGNAPFGEEGYDDTDYGLVNAPVYTNTKVQLLYEDSKGNLTPNFPPNTTIGYFIIANGWLENGYTRLTEVKKASASAASIQTKGEVTGTVKVKVGEYALVSLSDDKKNVSWTSADPSIATISGGMLLGNIKGIKSGITTCTATRKVLGIFTEKLGSWTVIVDGEGESTLDGSFDTSKPVFYSNTEWNSSLRCMTINTGKYIIYGFEDDTKSTGDNSLEDVLYTVSSVPAQAILDPNNPDILNPDDVLEEKLTVGEQYLATYCYEDLWPYEGDYDMNDVVIEHHAAKYFNNDNDLLEVRDTFIVCNEYASSGQGVKDAFAVRIPLNERGMMILPNGAYNETETESIILFENAQSNINKSFVITRVFDKGSISKDQIKYGLELDPYIIPVMPTDKIGYKEDNRREVHFPKKSGTIKVNPSYYNNTVEAFYVALDNNHPFAISIPLAVAKTREQIAKAKVDGSMYVVPSEMYSIEGQYAKSGHSYSGWAASKGIVKSTADWYKYYQVSGPDQLERVEMNNYK